MIATFDSASSMARALAFSLADRDFTRLGLLPPGTEHLAPLVDRLLTLFQRRQRDGIRGHRHRPSPGQGAEAAAGVLGLPLATYTGALLSDTSVPVWHRARRFLPFLFAAGSAASAGALATLATPHRDAAMARRLAVGGAIAEGLLAQGMEWSLGDAGQPYQEGSAGTLEAGLGLTLGGAAAIAAGRWFRPAGLAGAAGILAGTLLERLAVWRAGSDSARLTVR
jgi:hypothetical protein